MSQKMKNAIFVCLFVAATAAVVLWSFQNKNRYRPASAVNFVMNTIVEQRVFGKGAEKTVEETSAGLAEFEKLVSAYFPNSEIAKINEAAGEHPVKVSEQTMQLLKLAKEYSQQSNGTFDVTIAPLTMEWNVTGDNPHIPDEESIQSLLGLVNCNSLILDEEAGTAMLEKKGQAIDLGGIAKGYSCDIFRQAAERNGVTSGYASIGGNIVVIGKAPDGTDYRFGIRDPRGDQSEFIGTLALEGKTMATSGDYERYFEEDGVRYHHILNPRTGYPSDSGLISVSVICENGALADYLSTAIFVQGKEEAFKVMEGQEFQLVLVDKDKKVWISPDLKDNFQINPEKQGTYSFEFYGEEQ